MSYCEDVIASLKGQVIKKNEHKEEYVSISYGGQRIFLKYQILSIQGEAKEWTPYNAELNLQGIKVNHKSL